MFATLDRLLSLHREPHYWRFQNQQQKSPPFWEPAPPCWKHCQKDFATRARLLCLQVFNGFEECTLLDSELCSGRLLLHEDQNALLREFQASLVCCSQRGEDVPSLLKPGERRSEEARRHFYYHAGSGIPQCAPFHSAGVRFRCRPDDTLL